MRVTLEIVAGPELGRLIRLREDHVLQLGRTDWADVALPGDSRMSGVHFAVETAAGLCRVRDLESRNGTLLNGQPIAEQVLSDGDRITAGNTTFLVRIEGGSDAETVAAARAAAPPPLARPPQRLKQPVHYTVETCATGLHLYRGSIDEIAPADLAALLTSKYPLYLVVDFKKLGQRVPETLDEPEYLFKWLPEPTAHLVSPVVLPPGSLDDWPAVVEQGWGEDALVMLFSWQEKDALLEHLRDEVRAGDDSVVGYCWPCVLAPMLSYYQPRAIDRLMQGIDAILVEFPDLPETWQIFAKEDLTEMLNQLGLARHEPERAGTADGPAA